MYYSEFRSSELRGLLRNSDSGFWNTVIRNSVIRNSVIRNSGGIPNVGVTNLGPRSFDSVSSLSPARFSPVADKQCSRQLKALNYRVQSYRLIRFLKQSQSLTSSWLVLISLVSELSVNSLLLVWVAAR